MSAVDAPRPLWHRVMTRIVHASSYVAAVAITWIMVSTTLDVASRYLRNRSIAGVLEIGEIMLVVAVFLGMAYAEHDGQHIRTDLLTRRLPVTLARRVRIVGLAVMAVFVAWLAWNTSFEAWHSFRTGEYRFGVIEVPVWPAKIAVTVGLALLTLQALINLGDIAAERREKLIPDAVVAPIEDLTHMPDEDQGEDRR